MTRILPSVVPALTALLTLSACAWSTWMGGQNAAVLPAPGPGDARPVYRPEAGAVPQGSRTVEAFDTTTEADRSAALATPDTSGARDLGTTVASLGAAADPGLWMQTPLVSEVTEGRVTAENGTSVTLELRPATEGTGSRISLSALRLLGLSLTGLHTLSVTAL